MDEPCLPWIVERLQAVGFPKVLQELRPRPKHVPPVIQRGGDIYRLDVGIHSYLDLGIGWERRVSHGTFGAILGSPDYLGGVG
jgi:hypothetical protein